jgi:hypothetical protein
VEGTTLDDRELVANPRVIVTWKIFAPK